MLSKYIVVRQKNKLDLIFLTVTKRENDKYKTIYITLLMWFNKMKVSYGVKLNITVVSISYIL